jgi:hypothetical protein
MFLKYFFIIIVNKIFIFILNNLDGVWGLGIGDWGLGIG